MACKQKHIAKTKTIIHAYSKDYLDAATENLGTAFDYAINYCKMNAWDFSDRFACSSYSRLFGIGAPWVVSGMSGIELVMEVMKEYDKNWSAPDYDPEGALSEEYWSGWALSQYQWYCSRTFGDIFERIPLQEIVHMYHPYHEMDISEFIEELDRRYRERAGTTKLKRIRTDRGLSQSELSEKSGVKLRSIQMYEQRVNDIDKAQAGSLFRIARVLNCSIEDLLEDPIFEGELRLDDLR